MKLFVAVLVVCLWISFIDAIAWRGKDKNGDDVVRALKVLKSPRNGYPNTFEVVAGQKDLTDQDVDAIRFLFSTVWAPRHLVTHYSKDENSAELFSARWLLWKLVEYQNVDSAPEFDPGTDTKVSDYHLWLRSWTTLDYQQSVFDGANYHSLCTRLNDTQPRPDVRICVSIADKRIQSNRTDPNALKWSFAVANYPYQGNNSRLALKVSFNSKSIVKDIAESSEGNGNTQLDPSSEAALEVSTESDGSRGLAAWRTDIDVIGPGCNPTGTIKRSVVYEGQVSREFDNLPNGDPDLTVDKVHRVVYFSFITNCQPVGIDWDPEIGVDDIDSGVSVAVPSIFLLALVVMFQLFM